jgi:hypothetical protein
MVLCPKFIFFEIGPGYCQIKITDEVGLFFDVDQLTGIDMIESDYNIIS